MSVTPRSGVRGAQTALRGVELLEAVVASDTPLSLSDLSLASGLDRSATYRVMRALEEAGYVSRIDSGRTYTIGGRLVALAGEVHEGITVISAAREAMDRVADLTKETVVLYTLHDRERVAVSVVESRQQVRRVVRLGTTLPLYAGPSGKVILAHLPTVDQEAIVSAAPGPKSRIKQQLADIRGAGYFAAVGDQTPGVGSISVPIFSRRGVVASITASGPGERWNVAAMEKVAQDMVNEAEQVSQGLGHLRHDQGVTKVQGA